MKTLSKRMVALLLLAGTTLFLNVGCSDKEDSAPAAQQPTNDDMEDIAEDFGSALASEDEGMLGMWSESGSGNFSDEISRTNTLDDTLVIENQGYVIARVRNFYDVNNVWSELFIPNVSARMEQTLTAEGTRTNNSGNRSVTISHHDSIQVFGLLPIFDVKTVDGNGERNVDGEFQSRFRQNVRTFESHYVWTITDLQLHNDRAEHPYPLDGSLAVNGYWINTHTNPGRDVAQSVTFDFVIHFDGSRYAQMVFANGSVFWIDLANGWCSHNRPGNGG